MLEKENEEFEGSGCMMGFNTHDHNVSTAMLQMN